MLNIDERTARAALTYLANPCDIDVYDRIQSEGAETAALDLAGRRGLPIPDLESTLQQVTQKHGLIGARFMIPSDPDWPAQLNDLPGAQAPYGLWVAGDASLNLMMDGVTKRSVAIVGARAATSYGEHVAHQFASEMHRHSVRVISGGAYGVDAAAHRGALASGGQTILVSAASLGRTYPAGHVDLFARIGRAEGCAIVTEAFPGTAPTRYRFLARNRIIAALSRGVVVVEAGQRSGSMNTVNHASRIGRPVGAVPGPITSAASTGTNELIRGGVVRAILNTADIVGMVNGAKALTYG